MQTNWTEVEHNSDTPRKKLPIRGAGRSIADIRELLSPDSRRSHHCPCISRSWPCGSPWNVSKRSWLPERTRQIHGGWMVWRLRPRVHSGTSGRATEPSRCTGWVNEPLSQRLALTFTVFQPKNVTDACTQWLSCWPLKIVFTQKVLWKATCDATRAESKTSQELDQSKDEGFEMARCEEQRLRDSPPWPTSFFNLSYLDYPNPESALNLFVSLSLASRICSSSLRISFTRIPNLLLISSYLVYSHPVSALHPFASRLLASRICSSSFRISFTRISYLLQALPCTKIQ